MASKRARAGEQPANKTSKKAVKRKASKKAVKKTVKNRAAKGTAKKAAKTKTAKKAGKKTSKKASKKASRKATKTAKKRATKPRARGRAARPSWTVANWMTASPHSIGRDQSLAHAHDVMNTHRIRHLPVLEGGQLVGIVSQRDLYFVESLDSTSPSEITVEEAMTQDVFEVSKDAALREVVQDMFDHKHGCAVVTEAGRVAGVFSTTDALRVLLEQLG